MRQGLESLLSRSNESKQQVQVSWGHIIIMDQIWLCFSSSFNVKVDLGFLTSSLSWAGVVSLCGLF